MRTIDSILNLLLGQQLFVPLQQQLYMHEQSRAQFRRRLKVLTNPLQEVKGQSLPETTTCSSNAWPLKCRFQADDFFGCLFRKMRGHTCSRPRAVLLCSSTLPVEPHSPVTLTALTGCGKGRESFVGWKKYYPQTDL